MKQNSLILGIDFGTSKCTMSWFNPRSGQAEIIKNAQGEDKTPSVVYFGPNEVLVGSPAENMLEDEDQRLLVFTSVKRYLGTSTCFALPSGQQVTPLVMTTAILQKLKLDAETGHFHETIDSVVLTCPASFTEQERKFLKTAAEKTGFQTVVLLEEPVAAALAYGHAGFKCGDNLLVYDLGGGTFDLAVLTREAGRFRLLLEPRGVRGCGGDDFDRAIYDHLEGITQKSLCRTISGTDSYDLQFLRLCRQRKENLSDRDRCEFSTYLTGGVRFKHSLERSQFESLIQDVVEQTIKLTRAIVEDAKSSGHNVNTVVLIGGASRVPLVKRLLTTSAGISVEPQRWQQQDVAVALGAAYYGQLLQSNDGPRPNENRSASCNLEQLHLILLAEMAYASVTGNLTVPAQTIAKILAQNQNDETAMQDRLTLLRPLLEKAKQINANIDYELLLKMAKIEVEVGDKSAEATLSKALEICSTETCSKSQFQNLIAIYELQSAIGSEQIDGTRLFAKTRMAELYHSAVESREESALVEECIFFGKSLARLGDHCGAVKCFNDAESVAEFISLKSVALTSDAEDVDLENDFNFMEIGVARAESNDFPGAEATQLKIKDEVVAQWVTKAIAVAQARLGNVFGAVQIAKSIPGSFDRTTALADIVFIQLNQNAFEGARVTLSEIVECRWGFERIGEQITVISGTALKYCFEMIFEKFFKPPHSLNTRSYPWEIELALKFAERWVELNDQPSAKLAFETSFAFVNGKDPTRLPADLLAGLPACRIAKLCVKLNDIHLSKLWFQVAREQAERTVDEPEKWKQFASLATSFLETGDIEEARRVTFSINDDSMNSPKWQILVSIASYQALVGNYDEAVATATTIPLDVEESNESVRGIALCAIVSAALRAGDFETALSLYKAADCCKYATYLAITSAKISYGRISASEIEEIENEWEPRHAANVFIHAAECLLSSDADKGVDFFFPQDHPLFLAHKLACSIMRSNA